jgi:DNA polymerase
VYDLFECGPNHRYAVLTDCGPVIIHNCENEIQALGRDVLRDAMIACNTHAPEYPMVIDVHDEIVFEVPEDIDETSIDRICTLMTTSSPWAQGLPLEVEWGLTDNYKK